MAENDRSWPREDNSWRKTTGHGASQMAFKPKRTKGVFLFNWLNVAIDKLNNAKWRRSDLPMIGRLVMCQGIGVLLNGLTGTPSMVTNSANIGLAYS